MDFLVPLYSKKKQRKKKNSRGKMKRRDCGKADLSLRSLRPVVWALTLFDIKLQRWERQREAETETQRGRHQSSYAFRGCVNVSHAMMGRLVQGSIALITFISFGGVQTAFELPLLPLFSEWRKDLDKKYESGKLRWCIKKGVQGDASLCLATKFICLGKTAKWSELREKWYSTENSAANGTYYVL